MLCLFLRWRMQTAIERRRFHGEVPAAFTKWGLCVRGTVGVRESVDLAR